MQIITENLTYYYGEKSKSLKVKALDNVSVQIQDGDFFGIIGKTGSGKSTFIQHLNGLIKLEKDRGSIVVGDFDLKDKKCDLYKLRSKVGMVFQYPEYQLFAETIFDDIAFGYKNFNKNASEKEVENAVKNACELVHLDYERVKDRSPFEISGGQKRRVAIAGVLAQNPEVLILDEPVAGLDPVGKKDLMDMLHYIHGRAVKTIVIVSHDMDMVAKHCNQIAVFNEGKVVLTGSPEVVFKNEELLNESGLFLPLTIRLNKELEKVDKGVGFYLDEDKFIEKIVEKFGGKK